MLNKRGTVSIGQIFPGACSPNFDTEKLKYLKQCVEAVDC